MKIKFKTEAMVLLAAGASTLLLSQTPRTVPFSLVIRAIQTDVKAGSEIQIELTMTNISAHPIKISKSNPVMEYEFDVRDPQNRPAQETAELKRVRNAGGAPTVFRLIGKTLQPKESLRENFAISDYYDMSQPGTYLIQVQRHVPQQIRGGVVKSNTLAVTVTH